jgi:hypothetical protein
MLRLQQRLAVYFTFLSSVPSHSETVTSSIYLSISIFVVAPSFFNVNPLTETAALDALT